MNDNELRALVRDAVARHLGQSNREEHEDREGSFRAVALPVGARIAAHPSHVMYLTLVNEGDACLIEPAVPCNHCGYCKSHGH